MIINVDQEWFEVINQVCDAVLKSHWINAINIAVTVLTNVRTIEEKPSETPIEEETQNEPSEIVE
jgi:hypothetical protein